MTFFSFRETNLSNQNFIDLLYILDYDPNNLRVGILHELNGKGDENLQLAHGIEFMHLLHFI